MTTSDPNKNGHNGYNVNNGSGKNGTAPAHPSMPAAGQGGSATGGQAPSGFLDDKMLTQMANEMFKASPELLLSAENFAAALDKALPQTGTGTGFPSAGSGIPSIPGMSTTLPGMDANFPAMNGQPPNMNTSLSEKNPNLNLNQTNANVLGAQPGPSVPTMMPGVPGVPGSAGLSGMSSGSGMPAANPSMPGMNSSLPGMNSGMNAGSGMPNPNTFGLPSGVDSQRNSGFNAGTANGASVSSPEALMNVPAGTIPGGFNLGDFTAVPEFSFLNEIRPILNYSVGASNQLASGNLPAGNLPAANLPSAGFDNFASGNMQDPFRSMPSSIPRIDVIPTLAPANFQQAGAINNLNLITTQFDVEAIRRDFPILQEQVNGHQLIWLDNAATTQKPQSVIDRLSYFYTHENSNVHRAAHELAARSTDAYEHARENVRRFLNASSVSEIVFVRGATEAINLVAQSWGRQNIQKDDEILITHLEHHANIVPWQMLCAEKGARLKVAPVDDHGQIILEQYERLLGPRTRFASLAQVSNALGTVTPIKAMIDAAHRYGAKVLVDGAQAVSHMQVDMQALDCDFYVFSGHKVFAPTGIGVLYGKSDVLQSMAPWQGGGNMIKDVTFERTTYHDAPLRFEAGTGSIGDAVGLGAAIEYLDRVGMANVSRHEHDLLVYGMDGLKRIPGLHLVGTAAEKAGVLSFVLDGYKTEDVSSYLNQQGIAVRAGHHCAQPILRRFGLESTVRPSLALYNTCEDIDALIKAVWDLTQGRNPGLQ